MAMNPSRIRPSAMTSSLLAAHTSFQHTCLPGSNLETTWCLVSGVWCLVSVEVLVSQAYIVGAVRTPVGRRNGGLASVHPVDLGAHVLAEVVSRTGIDPAAVEDVIMGCVSQIGPQSVDIARNAWLSAGLPEGVPGVTIDRQCGSSQQGVHFAAH